MAVEIFRTITLGRREPIGREIGCKFELVVVASRVLENHFPSLTVYLPRMEDDFGILLRKLQ